MSKRPRREWDGDAELQRAEAQRQREEFASPARATPRVDAYDDSPQEQHAFARYMRRVRAGISPSEMELFFRADCLLERFPARVSSLGKN